MVAVRPSPFCFRHIEPFSHHLKFPLSLLPATLIMLSSFVNVIILCMSFSPLKSCPDEGSHRD